MAKPRKRKEKRNVPKGIAYIQSTFNNTIVTFTDIYGNSICWSAGGTEGFKNSRKSTPYAAQLAAESAAKKALDAGMREVEVNVKGPGAGRESAIRAIQAAGIKISVIRDITPVPHNGCRPRKKRRV
jgi:small subunit ribosomal protein S11